MRSLPESDWRKLRAIREKALERFCSNALSSLRTMLETPDPEAGPHKAYLDVYRHIQAQDKRLSTLFDDWRRSVAVSLLISWVKAGLLTSDELESFSESTRRFVHEFLEATKPSEMEA